MYTGKEGNPTTLLPSVTSSGPVNVETQVDLSGGFLQSVWNHAYSSRGGTTLMVSYDAYTCDDFLREGRKTFNADFQSNFARGSRHEFVWGLGYRYSASHSDGNLSESLNPASLNTQLFSGFAQDEVALVPDRVYLTVGTKLEHNYYSGFGVMPSVRVTYAPNDHHMLWAAVSRALRTPAAADTSIRVNFAGFSQPDGTHVLIGLRGNPRFKNEGLTAYEMGYRTTVGEHLSVDFAAYYHAYDHQQTIEPATPFFETTPLPAHLVLPSTRQNLLKGEAHGLEIAANWKATRHWTISTGYDFERIHMRRRALSQDLEEAANVEGTDPHVHAQIRSHVDLSERLSWDASTYFVDRLNFHGVPAYTRLDTGVSWQWSKGLSLSLVGQNLVQDHHLEFVDDSGARRSKLIKRGAYAKITWKF